MSQDWAVEEIIPGSTAPATDIIKLTDALDALKSNFGGASLPTTNLVAGMLVVLDSGKKYIRNPANDGWIDQDEVYARLTGSSSQQFAKVDSMSPAFTKTGAGTLSIKAGTTVVVAGLEITFAAATAVTMPSLSAGTDYAIYACTDGTVRADASFSAPSGYTTANSRKIGGFHYGLVAAGTTVAGGSFATTGTGMIWTQADVDKIAGINQFSIWDSKFRPASDPRGMVLVDGQTWVDIYLCSTDADTNGTSKYNTNIASGSVLPKIPVAFGGNGSTTYAAPTWWDFNEIAHSQNKRMLYEHEFITAAYGVTESQSIGGAASTYPTTLRNAGYTSKYGIEEATGHHWIWGLDSAGASSTAWIANGGRGQSHADTIRRPLLGGSRVSAADSGSRCSSWSDGPGYVYWGVGLRAACDHMQLA